MTNIVKYPDSVLTTKCIDFDFANPPIDANKLSEELMQSMINNNGVGLAANQIGYPYRVFTIRGLEFNYVCFNPKIVSQSDETSVMEEGCLSFPGLVVKIKRSTEIRVRFQTPSGLTDTKTFNGLTARIFQHELDHLDGIVFYNRANKFHRDQALRKWHK